jgi:hypothetical protein
MRAAASARKFLALSESQPARRTDVPDDWAMESLLALPALSFGGERHDVADLIMVGLITCEWQVLKELAARGLGLEADRAGHIGAEELDRALTAFRYDRRLIAAADLRGWLSERSLQLADLEGVVRRQLLRGRFDGVLCPAVTDAAVAMVIRAEAMCGGALTRLASELRAWHAGSDWVAQTAVGGSPAGDPAAVEKVVAAALADATPGLPAFGPAELRRRAVRLAALNAGYLRFREAAVAETAVDARLAEHRLEWTVVRGSELSFELEGAARETRLCVVHDGGTLAQVARTLGLEPARREVELGSAPAELAAGLLTAREGDLVGPWCEGGRWRVLEVGGRFEPERDGDGRVRARARQELLGELVERFSAGKADNLAAL